MVFLSNLIKCTWEKKLISNAKTITIATTCSRGKSWVVDLWTHYFYSMTHSLLREQVMAKVVISTFFQKEYGKDKI